MWIKGRKVFLDRQFVDADLRIQDGKIAEIAVRTEKISTENTSETPMGYVIPGLVDIHSHGRVGEDFSFADKDGIRKMCESYAECGVTAVLATTMTNAPETIAKAMKTIGEYRETEQSGARLLGINMEGPFLGADKKGAHDERYLRPIDQEWFKKMQELSKNSVRIVSIDPRLKGAQEFIREQKQKGVKISLAHTGCNYETARQAIETGCDHVTHLFNAMNPLHHREPGLIGAAIDHKLYSELICDGIHVHPAMIRMMFALHPEKMILISDSMQAAGLCDGEYELGGLKVYVKNGKATQEDGTIAGSTTDVYSAMVNAIRFGVPAEQAVLSASRIPAESVGLEDKVGSIKVGRDADLVVTDAEWRMEQVYLGGKTIKKIFDKV